MASFSLVFRGGLDCVHCTLFSHKALRLSVAGFCVVVWLCISTVAMTLEIAEAVLQLWLR
jgi:hypothetical protein